MKNRKILAAILSAALAVTAVTATGVYPTSLTAYAEDKTNGSIYFRALEDDTWEVYITSSSNLTKHIVPATYAGKPVSRIADGGFAGNWYLDEVEIAEGITSIGKRAFNGCQYLKKITIPSTVTSIGSEAFVLCYFYLTDIKLPEGLTRIEASTFKDCYALKNVNIPSGVTYIGDNAFSGCSKLSSAELPPNLKTIGEKAFSGCGAVPSITIPDSVESIGNRAFYTCKSITEVVVPDGVTSFGSGVFSGCENLKTAVLPKNLTSIPASTFYDCTNLTAITITDKIESIGSNAFSGCKSLTSIYIPKSVKSINTGALYSSGLKDLYYEGSQIEWERDVVLGDNSLNTTKVTMHYNQKRPVGVPVKINITASGTDTSNRTVTVKGGSVNKTIAINDGMLDLTGIPNGTYTFTFSAKNCAPRAYSNVTVSGGMATGISEVKLNLIGDIDGNGKVNTLDVAQANAHVKNKVPLSGYDLSVCDADKNGKINTLDVAALNAHAKNKIMLW